MAWRKNFTKIFTYRHWGDVSPPMSRRCRHRLCPNWLKQKPMQFWNPILAFLGILNRSRRKVSITCSLLCTVFFLADTLIMIFDIESLKSYTTWICLLGKMSVTLNYQGEYFMIFWSQSSNFLVIFVWMGELFPTPLRASAFSIGMIISTLGGVVAPFLINLNPIWLPYAIFG